MNLANKMIPLLMFLIVGAGAYLMTTLTHTTDMKTTDEQSAPPLSAVLNDQPDLPTGVDNNFAAIGAAEQGEYLETTQTVAANQVALEKRLDEFEVQMTEKILTRLEQQMGAKSDDMLADLQGTLTTFTDHALSAVDEKIAAKPTQRIVVDEEGNVLEEGTMPPGLGFDGVNDSHGDTPGRSKALSPTLQALAQQRAADKLITLRPHQSTMLDAATQALQKPSKRASKHAALTRPRQTTAVSRAGIKSVNQASGLAPSASLTDKGAAPRDKRKPKPTPMYTIPVVGTLFSNTTLTALMGVVPEQGKLNDPIRFKVITGGKNIATNGHYMPGIRNIVWSGWASGNREMSCVRGIIDKTTFTFDDGTVHTVISRDKTEGLGYIANQHGDPCIPGLLISNAEQYLKDRLRVAAVGSLASAAASMNTTKINNPDADLVETLVSGDTKQFLVAETFAGTMKEMADYIKERQLNSVSLVYLPTGQDVTLHIEQSINIDYDINGRRLVHDDQVTAVAHRSFD